MVFFLALSILATRSYSLHLIENRIIFNFYLVQRKNYVYLFEPFIGQCSFPIVLSLHLSIFLYICIWPQKDTEKKTKSIFCHEIGFIIFWILTIWIWFDFSMASYCVYPFVDLVYFQITTHIYTNLVAIWWNYLCCTMLIQGKIVS